MAIAGLVAAVWLATGAEATSVNTNTVSEVATCTAGEACFVQLEVAACPTGYDRRYWLQAKGPGQITAKGIFTADRTKDRLRTYDLTRAYRTVMMTWDGFHDAPTAYGFAYATEGAVTIRLVSGCRARG